MTAALELTAGVSRFEGVFGSFLASVTSAIRKPRPSGTYGRSEPHPHRAALLAGTVLGTALLCFAEPASAQSTPSSPSLVNLGALYDGIDAQAFGLSDDGQVVAGTSGTTGRTRAFRWTPDGGLRDLGTIGGNASRATAVSADGNAIVGASTTGGTRRSGSSPEITAFRWTEASGFESLRDLGGGLSVALGVDTDGGTIVGYSSDGIGDYNAVRWTGGRISRLSALPNGSYSFARAVTGDGTIAVGDSGIGSARHAVRWTRAGVQDLGVLARSPSGETSIAFGTSRDGQVAVGFSSIAPAGGGATPAAYHAFRWTPAGGMIDLGTLPGLANSLARATNGVGSVIVGESGGVAFDGIDQERILADNRAFRWTAADGMVDLNLLLANAGVDMNGATLVNATGVSGDGQFIVGAGFFNANATNTGPATGYIARYIDAAVMAPPPPPPPPPPLSPGTSLVGLGQGTAGYAISGDGGVVVGRDGTEAFRWTASGGLIHLQAIGGANTEQAFAVAYGISDDGNFAVGQSPFPGGEVLGAVGAHAVRWDATGTPLDLGTFADPLVDRFDLPLSRAVDASGDGEIVVGSAHTASGYLHAFRWTQAGGLTDLGAFGDLSTDSLAHAVNSDGSVVVGVSSTPMGYYRGFYWTAAKGFGDLGSLSPRYNYSEALGVNAAGSVVVGLSSDDSGAYHAFRWAGDTGMTDLGTLGYGESAAHAVDADGGVIVGYSVDSGGQRAFRWTEADGMRDLNALLAAAGVDLTGTMLLDATDVSLDGQFITGTKTSDAGTQAYVARLTAPPLGAIPALPGPLADIPAPASNAAVTLMRVGGANQAVTSHGISGDGLVVAGRVSGGSSGGQAFRWTQADGIQPLGYLPDNPNFRSSTAYAVNRDGPVLVGSSSSGLAGPNPSRRETVFMRSAGPPAAGWSISARLALNPMNPRVTASTATAPSSLVFRRQRSATGKTNVPSAGPLPAGWSISDRFRVRVDAHLRGASTAMAASWSARAPSPPTSPSSIMRFAGPRRPA